MAREIGGIKGVLSGLVSEPDFRADSSRKQSPETKPRKGKPKPARKREKTSPSSLQKDKTPVEKQPARRGRPPGRKSGEVPIKEKATLWVSAALMAEYRDWSWDERCNLGELVERALADYRRRKRAQQVRIRESDEKR